MFAFLVFSCSLLDSDTSAFGHRSFVSLPIVKASENMSTDVIIKDSRLSTFIFVARNKSFIFRIIHRFSEIRPEEIITQQK